jgi:hypothetical protein
MDSQNQTLHFAEAQRKSRKLVAVILAVLVAGFAIYKLNQSRIERYAISVQNASEYNKMGYEKGSPVGFSAGKAGASVPTAMSLVKIAESHSKIDLGRIDSDFVAGFSAGYESGYKAATQKAF